MPLRISASLGQPGLPPPPQQSGSERDADTCHEMPARLAQRRRPPQIREATSHEAGDTLAQLRDPNTHTRPKHPDATREPRCNAATGRTRVFESQLPSKDNNTKRVCHSAAGTCHRDQPSKRATKISHREVAQPRQAASDPPPSVCDKIRTESATPRLRGRSNIRAASANHGASLPTTQGAEAPHASRVAEGGRGPVKT